MRLIVDWEMDFTGVERILEYTEQVPEEPVQNCSADWPTQDWLKRPRIELENVTVRYSLHGLPALQQITMRIEAFERVGLVGRTGAGKSSFASALFRMVPFMEGSISVDGERSLLGLSCPTALPALGACSRFAVCGCQASMYWTYHFRGYGGA